MSLVLLKNMNEIREKKIDISPETYNENRDVSATKGRKRALKLFTEIAVERDDFKGNLRVTSSGFLRGGAPLHLRMI